MGRPLRIQEPNHFFHVMNRGNNKQPLFFHEKDYLEYLRLIRRFKEKFSIKLYHYVLMPNHVHFLLEPTLPNTLSRFMQSLTLSHTKIFNLKHSQSGHVWQGRYKSNLIEDDTYLLQCGRYIELNPVRARLALHPAQYRWSSYLVHALGMKNKLVDENPLYTNFGSSPAIRMTEYQKFIEQNPGFEWRV